MRAIRKGLSHAVAAHLNAGADPNRGFVGNPPPLILAVLSEDPEVVRLLLEAGADPDLRPNQSQSCSMMYAVRENRNDDILKLLLEYGANPNLQDSRGETPLHLCVTLGRQGMARLLIDAGADVNLADNDGVTCLNTARSFHGLSDFAEMLLASGADPELKDRHGKVYLM